MFKKFSHSLQLVFGLFGIMMFACDPAYSGSTIKAHLPDKLGPYMIQYPWMGLVANEMSFGPITVSNVYLNKEDKIVFVKPNEKIKGRLRYKIDSDQLKTMHLYHLVVGIKGVGAQDCITHTLAVWDSKGVGHFELKAPSKPGVYHVRFNYAEALSCEKARETWNEKADNYYSAATIGIVIVE